MRTRVRDAGAVVGALGSGVTFSAILGSNRGRLDILSWSFAFFVFSLLYSLLLQALEHPRHFGIFALNNATPASLQTRTFLGVIPLVLLMAMAGFLMTLAIALSDPNGPAVVHSELAFKFAAYLMLSG